MFLHKIILTVIFAWRFINADVLVCDNNECKRAGVVTTDSLLTELNSIAEANRNTTQFLKELTERIDHNVNTLVTEIKNIKAALYENAGPHTQLPTDKLQKDKVTELTETDYSLYNNLWVVVQVRLDGSVNFYRNWTEYKEGFGDQWGEFFVGLEKIHKLTNDRSHELLILLEDFEGIMKYAHYDNFLIGNETEGYVLKKLGKYSGTAGNHLRPHLNMVFSTKDKDNDQADNGNCAEWFKGAWWYHHCLSSNLNGPYRYNRYLKESERGVGITWGSYDDIMYSYKATQMLLRFKE